jgi:hypothetical protein
LAFGPGPTGPRGSRVSPERSGAILVCPAFNILQGWPNLTGLIASGAFDARLP